MGDVRIISGSLRGRKVRTPEGQATRPLLSRLRKSLADILRSRLRGTQVLDLFGGSGAIAFELLSNGAAGATVVEIDAAAAELIRENARELKLSIRVHATDALDAIPRLQGEGETFDVIIVAPPYGRGLGPAALVALAAHWILAPGGTVVVQRDAREPIANAGGGSRLAYMESRRYGRTAFDFYGEA